jgi:hypothetical protein
VPDAVSFSPSLLLLLFLPPSSHPAFSSFFLLSILVSLSLSFSLSLFLPSFALSILLKTNVWPTPGVPSLGLRPVPEVHAEQIKCAELLDMMVMEERRGKRHPDLDDPYNQVRENRNRIRPGVLTFCDCDDDHRLDLEP